MIELCSGSMFDVGADVLICPVNCVGVMGKGLALEFKKRFPEYAADYALGCRHGSIIPGALRSFTLVSTKHRAHPKVILSFPTKDHWRRPSNLEWIVAGMNYLVRGINAIGISQYASSYPGGIAIPALGCGLGGLPWPQVEFILHDTFSDDSKFGQGPGKTRIMVFPPQGSKPNVSPLK